MKRKLFLIEFGLLVLTVPWFFTSEKSELIFGFPIWAFYSLIVSIIFAFVTAFIIGKYWEELSK